MYRDKKRYGQDPATVVRSKPATFNAPLHWKDPARVFVCSWSDFFHADVPDQCVIRKIPFFLKQMEVNGKIVEMPELDGRRWGGCP